MSRQSVDARDRHAEQPRQRRRPLRRRAHDCPDLDRTTRRVLARNGNGQPASSAHPPICDTTRQPGSWPRSRLLSGRLSLRLAGQASTGPASHPYPGGRAQPSRRVAKRTVPRPTRSRCPKRGRQRSSPAACRESRTGLSSTGATSPGQSHGPGPGPRADGHRQSSRECARGSNFWRPRAGSSWSRRRSSPPAGSSAR